MINFMKVLFSTQARKCITLLAHLKGMFVNLNRATQLIIYALKQNVNNVI